MSGTLCAPSIRTTIAALALHVARCAGVSERVPFADPNVVADGEARLGARREVVGKHAAVGPGQRKTTAGAALELVDRGRAGFDGQRRDAGQPVLEVRRREVVRRVHALDAVTERRRAAAECHHHREVHLEGTPLPILMEDRLRRRRMHRTESLQAAEVVDAIHMSHRHMYRRRMAKRVVVLGAGFAGLELSTRLVADFGDEVAVALIDANDSFVFGFSKLDVLTGKKTADAVKIPYSDLSRPGLDFRQERITTIDPVARVTTTDRGTYEADILVVALGAEYDMAATPGLAEYGHEFYSVAGAEKLRDALPSVEAGTVLIAVCGEPYKCPPAPFEAAFLLHDYFVANGVRDKIEMRVSGFMAAPVPVTEQVSQTILQNLADRRIEYIPKATVRRIDGDERVAVYDDSTIGYDLFIGIPVHRAPDVVRSSPLAEGDWVPVDTSNMSTRFPDVYAIGDVAAMPMAKAGVFAEGAARTVAADIAAQIRGTEPPPRFDGAGSCFIEFGGGLVGKVEANFLSGPKPTATLVGPSEEIAAEKAQFAPERRTRWFSG